MSAPILRKEAWEGLRDSIGLLEEVIHSAPDAGVESLRTLIVRMQQLALEGRDNLPQSYSILCSLCEELATELNAELLQFLDTGTHQLHSSDLLHALRNAVDKLHQQLRWMRRELDVLLPWLALQNDLAFFEIDQPEMLVPPYNQELPPSYWGIFEDNDPNKRLIVIANVNNDLSEYWEYSDQGVYIVDLSNEAYKFGVNYVMYALTH